MSSHYYPSLPKITELMSDQFYKDLVKSDCLSEDDNQDVGENFYELKELEEVFADHILIGKRLQKTLYRGHIEDLNEETDHPPIALTDLALQLFSKAVPNYGLDLLDMDYVSSVSEATRVSPCAMILALIYLERLQIKNSDYLESVSPSGLFVVTMMVASKFLFEDEEDIVTNQIWADVLNMDVKELNRLEQNFLAAIDWKLFVYSSEYFQYLSDIEKMIAVKQSSLRGWLLYSDVYSILQDAVMHKFLLSCIERIIKVSVMSAIGYAVTALSVYAAGLTIHRCSKSDVSEQNTLIKNTTESGRPFIIISSDTSTSEKKLFLGDSSNVEPILDSISPSNINENFNKELQIQKINDFFCLKKLSTTCNLASQTLSLKKSLYHTYHSGGFFKTRRIVVNHTRYRLQLWLTTSKNAFIPVLID